MKNRGDHGGSITRRSLVATALAGAATGARSVETAPTAPADLLLNDASGLNPTRVARHTRLADTKEPGIATLRSLLRDAQREARALVVGGARHSMGGQSLAHESSAVTLAAGSCVPRPDRSFLASSGTTWRQIIATLDPLGSSVAVMQSNNDFSVGGTLCVNGHGWAVPHGPFGTTVRRFRIMLADGSILTCSPDENGQLFRLAIGGYGLFGIILDAELESVDNVLLEPRLDVVSAANFAQRFVEAAEAGDEIPMAYGRLSIASMGFLDEAALVTFRRVVGVIPSAEQPSIVPALARFMLRSEVGSDWAKSARWYVETVLARGLAPSRVSRNRLLNQPVAALAETDRTRSDILHEYFIPPPRLNDFLLACTRLIPASAQDLLNVTLRYVRADPVSTLCFAPAARIGAVLLFSQSRTKAAEQDMRRLTERLVDEALACGGSFYLPYRLHARPDQVRAAYPGIDKVLAGKRLYDPRGRFRNMLFDRYFG